MFPRSSLILAALMAAASMQAAESMASKPGTEIETPQSGREIAVFNVRGGQVVLVEQLGGEVGFAAIGVEAMHLVQTLVGEYDLSGLEIYQVLGGNRMNAPVALVKDHAARYPGNPAALRGRTLPSLESITVSPMAASQSEKGQFSAGGGACIEGVADSFDYFTSWFFNYSGMFSGVGAYGNLGANGIADTGVFSNGDVNVNLGSTSAGAVCVCFPQDYPDYPPARVRVEERASSGYWVQIWSSNNPFTGAAYGYWFKGISIRRIRLLVRDNEVHTGHQFYWAGSY